MWSSDEKGALAGAPENHEVICSAFLSGVSSIVWKQAAIIGFLGAALLACGRAETDGAWKGDAPKAPADPAAEAGYLNPPSLTASRLGPGGAIVLVGQAAPASTVRMGAATGEAVTALADAAGRWTLSLPGSGQVRLFGLSMAAAGGRKVQSQGYLAILPDGRAAQLRSGASAHMIGPGSDPPRLLTVDFDRDGATSVAGSARAGSGVSLRIDRAARGAGKTDSQGRFHLVVERPVENGLLPFEIAGESGEQTIALPIEPAGDLQGPYRAVQLGDVWRIDWVTPGGGVQSTLVLGPAQAASALPDLAQ
jgi:hypothetical protein